jgi:S-adenosylmethionine/arginine decarboxylase-like enzyme
MDTAHDTDQPTDLAPAPTELRPADPAIGPIVAKAVRRRSFAVLATSSASGRPHGAGVTYQLADGHIWVSTYRESRKARNVAARPEVALTITVTRIPFFPPASVQIQGRARIVELDDPELRRLAATGSLKKVTGHGELDLDGGCYLRIELPSRVPVYGLGMSLWELARAPLAADRIAQVEWE